MKLTLTTNPIPCDQCGKTDWISATVINDNSPTIRCHRCDPLTPSDPPDYTPNTSSKGT